MFSILLAAILWVHPLHVSVTDIKYEEDLKSLQISSRIYLEDLELALQVYTGHDELDITDKSKWDFIDANLKRYVLERIKVYDEKEGEYMMNYLGAEIKEDVMWCYLEIEGVTKLEKVTVLNRILHEVWGDQNNMVHFRAFEEVKSARLQKGNETRDFEWD